MSHSSAPKSTGLKLARVWILKYPKLAASWLQGEGFTDRTNPAAALPAWLLSSATPRTAAAPSSTTSASTAGSLTFTDRKDIDGEEQSRRQPESNSTEQQHHSSARSARAAQASSSLFNEQAFLLLAALEFVMHADEASHYRFVRTVETIRSIGSLDERMRPNNLASATALAKVLLHWCMWTSKQNTHKTHSCTHFSTISC